MKYYSTAPVSVLDDLADGSAAAKLWLFNHCSISDSLERRRKLLSVH